MAEPSSTTPRFRLPAWENALQERLHRRDPNSWDSALAHLSSAADHGRLWFGTAAALAATGPRNRRAAVRGLVGLAAASALANGPAKLTIQRARPEFAGLPVGWLPSRLPVTSSFPSGHSASAAAFATGAALESPALAVPLGALAGAVAWSRVNTGVHYPSDVLAGLALGAGVSLALARLRPVVAQQAAPAQPVAQPAKLPDLGTGQGLRIVVNASADDPEAVEIAAAVREYFPDAQVRTMAEGEDLPTVLRAAAEGAQALGAAGGDGTINAAAARALAADLPLLVFPAGTLNHFAKALRITDHETALRAARDRTGVVVDVAAVEPHGAGADGSRVFVNNSSVGAYPRLVARREQLEDRIGKWPAALVALVDVLGRSEPEAVTIDGVPRRVWLLFAGNCRYLPGGAVPLRRDKLDDGLLDLRIVDATRRWSRTRLVLAALTGRSAQSPVVETRTVHRVRISGTQQPIAVARDGEIDDPLPGLDWTKAGTLRVWAPST